MDTKKQSLREQVYTHFCRLMKQGELAPGTFINQGEICDSLKISKAPLRDALIQMETEGFVTIYPRRGVMINAITLDEVNQAYQIIGALESAALGQAFPTLGPDQIREMEALNAQLLDTLEQGEFEEYYDLNNQLHNVFIDRARAPRLKEIVSTLKQRIYDFPLRPYLVDWEKENLHEHQRIIDSIRKNNLRAAMDILQFEHWSHELHGDEIRKFYGFETQ